MAQIVHPENPKAVIEGRVLAVGETVQQGDVYSSSTSHWDPAPMIGIKVREKSLVVYVRPASEEQKAQPVHQSTEA